MRRALGWLLLSLLSCSCAQSVLRRQTRGASSSKVKHSHEGWFQQKLDHLSKNVPSFWKQRYYMNDAFYKRGGPVFLFIEGSKDTNIDWITSNYTWITYAQRLGALCFLLEHRFYGQSQPTGNVNIVSLRYLSSKQALADIVYFQTEMAKEMGLRRNKWVTFGCSYGGSLAVWSRMKYPKLFAAAVGSSAPVIAKVDFFEYLEVLQQSLDTYNSGCSKAVKSASDHIVAMLKHPKHHSKLTQDFRLCKPLKIHSLMDEAYFLERLINILHRIVQYHKNETIKVQRRAVQIDDFCDMMTDNSLGSFYDRYVRFVDIMLQNENRHCLQADYLDYVMTRSNPLLDVPNTQARQWLYQACTEFGFFLTTESKTQPFSGVPLRYFLKKCSDIFGSEFTYSSLTAGVSATNMYYGGLDMKGSKIIFPSGSIDPWHAVGITKDISKSLPAVFIKGKVKHIVQMYTYKRSQIQLN
ncbi:PREDICTED: putative serine protease K12H4.7-like [Chrysochloris asiatica]|uniref:Serine protease K12H4.7-like n=1 Tax=Chrysochloris asiatica TaxID=185453 RepID=A0A9B0TGC0_CHRAS|nr:PREDICTED: putative serine protease K12H4.7-like [Chrysochloris asiatica]